MDINALNNLDGFRIKMATGINGRGKETLKDYKKRVKEITGYELPKKIEWKNPSWNKPYPFNGKKS